MGVSFSFHSADAAIFFLLACVHILHFIRHRSIHFSSSPSFTLRSTRQDGFLLPPSPLPCLGHHSPSHHHLHLHLPALPHIIVKVLHHLFIVHAICGCLHTGPSSFEFCLVVFPIRGFVFVSTLAPHVHFLHPSCGSTTLYRSRLCGTGRYPTTTIPMLVTRYIHPPCIIDFNMLQLISTGSSYVIFSSEIF